MNGHDRTMGKSVGWVEAVAETHQLITQCEKGIRSNK